MNIINKNYAVLTDFEVMEHLKRIQNKNYHSKMDTGQLPTITYETLKYLESMPCKNQSKKRIIEYMTQMKHLNFTEEQCVMLVNNPPTTLVQLHLVLGLGIREDDAKFILDLTHKLLL